MPALAFGAYRIRCPAKVAVARKYEGFGADILAIETHSHLK